MNHAKNVRIKQKCICPNEVEDGVHFLLKCPICPFEQASSETEENTGDFFLERNKNGMRRVTLKQDGNKIRI